MSYCLRQCPASILVASKKTDMKQHFTFLIVALLAAAAQAQTAYINGVPIAVVNSSTLAITDNIFNQYCPEIHSNSDGAVMMVNTFNDAYMVDVATNTVTDSMPGFTPRYAEGNTSSEMYGAKSGVFYHIDLNSKALDSITLPGSERIQRRPGSDEVWVTSDSSVHVVDVSNGMSLSNTIVTGSSQYDGSELRFSADGATMIKLNWNSKTVAKVDAENKTVTGTLDMSFVPNLSGIEVLGDGSAAFVSCSNNNKVYKIDVATMTVSDSAEMPKAPFGMYRHPFDGTLWVVGHFDQVVYVVDPSDLSVQDSVNVTGDPHIVMFVNTAVGVEEEMHAAPLRIYPNPASDVIRLEGATAGSTWSLLDMTGRSVASGQFDSTQQQTLSIASLPVGVYTLRSEEAMTRIIKQ